MSSSGEGGIRTRDTLRYTALAKLHDRPLWHLSMVYLPVVWSLECAESEGFEPTVPVKGLQFSKLLLSTTQPTLQVDC